MSSKDPLEKLLADPQFKKELETLGEDASTQQSVTQITEYTPTVVVEFFQIKYSRHLTLKKKKEELKAVSLVYNYEDREKISKYKPKGGSTMFQIPFHGISIDVFIREYYRQLKRRGIEYKDKEIAKSSIYKQFYEGIPKKIMEKVDIALKDLKLIQITPH